MIILTLNSGSSSLRYKVYNYTFTGWFLIIEGEKEGLALDVNNINIFNTLVTDLLLEINSSKELIDQKIDAVGCRVVHGGSKFINPVLIDQEILKIIRDLRNLAPLHNDIDATILEATIDIFPAIPVIGIFDTTFHHTLPKVSSTYALPADISEKYKLKRYGFHGIAHQFASKSLSECIGKSVKTSRLITCHLGNGASICAIKNGESVDTSMGLTPLEGLVMGTRSGDLDPGLIMYLINYCGISSLELDKILNEKSGLLGISGLSNDVRTLELEASKFNTYAEHALEVFAYRVSKYIGSYYVVLGGVDAISFSGGIGENSISMRSRICKRINSLGIIFDDNANHQTNPPFCITTEKSLVPAWVIAADENLEIAKQTYEFINHK